MSLLTHSHTNTPPHSLSLSHPIPLFLPPPSSWSWKKFCGVAITQVFYQSFQRRKIRAIVSGWSYGQKLHTYWVHLRLWLRSLHWWGPLLGGRCIRGRWLGLRADATPPHHTLSTPPKSPSCSTLTPPPPKPTKLLSCFYSPPLLNWIKITAVLWFTQTIIKVKTEPPSWQCVR